MRFEEKRGDLFSVSETTSVAHCISEDCRMGKGVAAIFKKKFEGVPELRDQVKQGTREHFSSSSLLSQKFPLAPRNILHLCS